ncbi:hypothetical protein GCM10027062_30940 [Nocardioides hungaricus]
MGSPLISAAELHGSLGTVTVLDVRYRLGGPGGRGEYERGHVPGAAYVDLDADLAAPPGAGGRHPLPATADFEAAMRRARVRDDRPVVVYDDWSGLAAGRAWWLLRYHGHPDVRVLDGAWPAWVGAGGAVHAGSRRARPPRGTAATSRPARAACRWSRPRGCSAYPCSWTRGRPSATAARSSRSTRWPGTSRAR